MRARFARAGLALLLGCCCEADFMLELALRCCCGG